MIDLADVENSHEYKFTHGKIDYTYTGGMILFDALFDTTFMVGLT